VPNDGIHICGRNGTGLRDRSLLRERIAFQNNAALLSRGLFQSIAMR
jgi:hypothetical protein